MKCFNFFQPARRRTQREDVKKDLEGLQTMRNLVRNMTFLMKVIKDGAEKYGLPEVEHGALTSFPDGK